MRVENRVQPTREQVLAFLQSGQEGPIVMVNLLKFRERAEYEDGRASELTGQEAYRIYAAGMKKLLEARGGRFVFSGTVRNLLLGEVESLWDVVGLAEYPSPAVMIEIATSPEFHAIEVHRVAGLAGQLNLTTDEDRSLVS
jgi:uncharacterized protein (DUF1330 family)